METDFSPLSDFFQPAKIKNYQLGYGYEYIYIIMVLDFVLVWFERAFHQTSLEKLFEYANYCSYLLISCTAVEYVKVCVVAVTPRIHGYCGICGET